MIQNDEWCVLVVDVGEADAIHRVADALALYSQIEHPARMLRSGGRHLEVVARTSIWIASNFFHRSGEVFAELAPQHAASSELDDSEVFNVIGALVAFRSEKLVFLLACE